MRRTLVWAGLLTLLAVCLAFVPLLDVLGYEFALAMALAGSFAAADLGAAYTRRMPPVTTGTAWGRAAVRNLALLVPPLIVISLNGLRRRNCDYLGGLVLYALIPGVSVLVATTVGVVAALALPRRPRLQTAAALGLVGASLALAVLRFYRQPPIFAYDPFAGYFPGTLYDENISLSWPYFWARGYHAALCLTALALVTARRNGWRGRTVLVAVGAGVAAAVLLGRGGDLGFAPSAGDIATALGGVRETPHFVIYYPRGAAFEPQMDDIAREHELRWAQVERAFGVAPAGKITSFYFASAADKARWMGAENTYIAKPWRREIYLAHEDFPHGALRHEIAHVFAGGFGDPLFHVSVKWWGWPPARFNVGLIEGAAVAADWPALSGAARLTPDQSVKAMLELHALPPLRAILAPGFFRFSAAQSYAAAGSFCHFLLERYGAARFRAIYRAGGAPADFLREYGKPLAELEAEWHAAVATTPLADEELEAARERFRRGGIFQRPCPHAVARLQARADAALKRGDAPRAVAALQKVCADDPAEPVHRLALGAALERADRVDEAVAIYRGLADDGAVSAALRARAALRLVDALLGAGDTTGAAAAVEAALALPIDEPARRNLLVRRRALGERAGAAELRRYFTERGPSGEPDALLQLEHAHELIEALPPHGLGHYLAGRILFGRAAWDDAARELGEAARLGLEDPLVARENDRLLVAAAFLARQLETSRRAATRLSAPEQPLGVRLEAADWLERLRFAVSGAL
jgi:tetratricopeptide (TPR) repeat protein